MIMSTIRKVLERKGGTVLTTQGHSSVFDAINRMSQANVGSLVIEQDGRPLGIFTERDYLRKIALEGRSSRETSVEDVMTSPLITITPEDDAKTAMETMTQRRCRHLVVVDGQQMVGIVSIGDLVKHLLIEKEAEIEHLSGYIAGSY